MLQYISNNVTKLPKFSYKLSRKENIFVFFLHNYELALWSRGRKIGSHTEGPRFDLQIQILDFYQIVDGCSIITSQAALIKVMLLSHDLCTHDMSDIE